MKLSEYIKDHLLALLLPIACLLFFVNILFMIELNINIIIIIVMFFLINYCIIVAYEYYRVRNYFNTLFTILDNIDNKYLFCDVMVKPCNNQEEKLYEIFSSLSKSMYSMISERNNQINDYRDFVELWIHEVKIPLSTLIFMSNKLDKKYTKELRRLQNEVEQVLYYIKSDYIEKDYYIREIKLMDVIDNVISDEKEMFIEKKISLKLDNLNVIVLSDYRWLSYIIKQVLSNSLKYTQNNGKIMIYTCQSYNYLELIIEDNGIGILPEDLPRVFEKGFTGNNNLNIKESSGIGLYLCKKICKQLHHNIRVESLNTTKVIITFPKGQFNNVF